MIIYPLTICFDRYDGIYSGGLYTAWNCDSEYVPTEISDDYATCADFWSDVKNDRYSFLPTFGVGSTAEEAVENLRKKLLARLRISERSCWRRGRIILMRKRNFKEEVL